MYQSPKNLLTDYMERPERRDPGADGWFDLEDWVGPQHPSGRGDVAKIEGILANSGDYSLERTQGPTGYWGLALDDGIRKYQKRNGLKVDGALRPGGPTIRHMEDSFGATLNGYAPPTPEDIDAHHDIVGDGNPGTIAWRRPDVSFKDIPDLPEIDQATDASNARLARAMCKTSDVTGYAKLFAQTIEDSGASGLAAVRDCIAKYEEAMPGKGGQLASAVVGFVPEKTQKELGIEAPKAPPPGTKVAITDVLGDAGMALLGGLLAAGTAATGIKGAGDTKKIIENFKLPGFTPADNENTQTPPSGPSAPNLPTHTGGPIPAPIDPNNTGSPMPDVDPSSIHTPTESPEERRKKISELVGNYLEIRIFGGRRDYRGNDLGIDSTTMIAKVCAEEAEKSGFADLLVQKGGGNLKGEEKKYMEEVTLSGDHGTRRSDYAIGPRDEKNPKNFGHINGYTSKADDTPIAREVEAYLDMLNIVPDPAQVAMVRKMRPGEDMETYRENIVRPACRKIIDAEVRKLREGMKGDK